ncbi:anthrax toxin receptor-like [Castor canadensis]|uniref:Anthrax toxin receptor-like n=1 Tax=Castor canadensis TaxID=51338 RepID=A0AC58N1W2_CASCN
MGFHGPRVPCSVLFLLLLLLLPPLFCRAGSLKYHGPGWRIFHRLAKGSRSSYHRRGPGAKQHLRQAQGKVECQGAFDLYLILDKSGSVDNNWNEIYSFVEQLVKKLQNPNLRMSFILYSTDATILLPLTSDKEKIHKGLSTLEQVVPEGYTNMQFGFEKALLQMTKANSGGKKVPSMIIALTDGTLVPEAFEKTQQAADRSRKMGAVVYTVGVLDYNKDQMRAIADSPEKMFGVDNGFQALPGIADAVASKTCTEVTSLEPSALCTGVSNEVVINGKGFHNAKSMDEIICRFKFKDSKVLDKKAINMTDTTITCPAPKIENPGEEVSIEVSLNNGITFFEKLNITSTSCAETVTRLPLLAFLPALLLIPLLLWCCWRLCYRKPVKEPPPPSPPPEEPEEEPSPPPPPPAPPPCVNTYPTVIISCWFLLLQLFPQLPADAIYLLFTQGPDPYSPLLNGLGLICLDSHNLSSVQTGQGLEDGHSPGSVICLQPSRECCTIPQAPCSPKIGLRPTREYVPIAQTLCTPRMCVPPSQPCPSFSTSSQYHYLPTPCSRSPSRMLPLLSPHARRSAESLGHPNPCRPTSKGPKP